MATQPVQADTTSTVSTVQVTAAMGSAGQALPATASSSISLSNNNLGGNPVEYKVGNGPWTPLDSNQGIELAIDLSATAVLLRKLVPKTPAIEIGLTVNNISRLLPLGVPLIVIGTTAPSNSDGRADGTVYIQTA